MASMDQNVVSDFMLTDTVGNIVGIKGTPSPDVIQKLKTLFISRNGRLPSSAPLEQAQMSGK